MYYTAYTTCVLALCLNFNKVVLFRIEYYLCALKLKDNRNANAFRYEAKTFHLGQEVSSISHSHF